MARFELDYNQGIEPGQPAEEAVRTIYTVLLADLRKNIPGTIEGDDPEHLHDLRVATRRTRSLLTQLKKVLPAEEVRFFAAEFKWLGQLTGPCRDFDVWIVERGDQRARQSAAEGALFDPFDARIAKRRAHAHAAVIEGLRSHRFAGLLEKWEAFLRTPTTPAKPPANARCAVKTLADKRIVKAYQRLVRRSSDVDSDLPADKIHRLRIDAKKLRYLLEFFRSLYPAGALEPSIGELKTLQDALGGFNDMEVQRGHLTDLRADLENEVGADTLRAMDQLATDLADRQQRYLTDLRKRLENFTGKTTQSKFDTLFKAET